MSGFRRSRVAMLIDLVLLPLGVLIAIMFAGIPDVLRQLREYPKYFTDNWRGRGWFSEHNKALTDSDSTKARNG